MKVESEITVWSLFDDMRSINFADDGNFLNFHGRYFSLKYSYLGQINIKLYSSSTQPKLHILHILMCLSNFACLPFSIARS